MVALPKDRRLSWEATSRIRGFPDDIGTVLVCAGCIQACCPLRVAQEAPGEGMLRLDSGAYTATGDFRCSVLGCGWAKQGVTRQAAEKHMQRHHSGMARGISRTPEAKAALALKRRLPDEEKKARNRANCRRYREEVKAVLTGATVPGGTGEQEQQASTALLLLSGLDAIRPQGSLCVSDSGSVGVFANVVPNGCGRRIITGSSDPSFLDAAQVAITWVSLHAGWLRARGVALCGGGAVQRKGPFSRSGLHGPVEDVGVSFMAPHSLGKKGSSAGACVALALVQWLLRPATTRGVVSVTGSLSLRGYLWPAGGIEEKVGHAQRRQASMLIMSEDAYEQVAKDDFASLPEELRPVARSSLRKANSMFDVLEHAFEGFEATPIMEQCVIDSALVGWATACGLEGRGAVNVECCHVRPGTMGGLILTGCVQEEMREVVRQMVLVVPSMCQALGEAFGLEGKRLSLCKKGHDLHVNINSLYGAQVHYLSYMAALAVALVGLMVGRRPSDTQLAVLGEVTPDWVLRWEPGLRWSSADVASCRAQGIRRLVVPEGICMDEAGWAAARTVEEDGRPCVDVVCMQRSERIFPMLRAVLDRKVQGWSMWDSDSDT